MDKKMHQCKEKEREDGDKLFDKKPFQEHQFRHAMQDQGCAPCGHDDSLGSPRKLRSLLTNRSTIR